ncbi:hypothetical protein F4780DRAFT_286680 [Xylariomycetidae sp. FL0641]|nr:hypothetical protein F4780DRAFT_286680 [Xylariomycetidae sp. FL0641]
MSLSEIRSNKGELNHRDEPENRRAKKFTDQRSPQCSMPPFRPGLVLTLPVSSRLRPTANPSTAAVYLGSGLAKVKHLIRGREIQLGLWGQYFGRHRRGKSTRGLQHMPFTQQSVGFAPEKPSPVSSLMTATPPHRINRLQKRCITSRNSYPYHTNGALVVAHAILDKPNSPSPWTSSLGMVLATIYRYLLHLKPVGMAKMTLRMQAKSSPMCLGIRSKS